MITLKKLKPSKKRIHLLDGRELHFHSPKKDAYSVRLASILPEHFDLDAIEVEIGCGKGEYLAQRASLHNERFFVGIDRRKDRFNLTERKLHRQTTEKNWVLLQCDARRFVGEELPPIQVLHVYHPDPWPKAKQNKHRFFRSPDAREWASAIVTGGQLRISSDHREYFEEIIDIIESWQDFSLELVIKKEHYLGDPVTHFEKIFLNKKEPVYKAFFKKRQTSNTSLSSI
jgi:tRNA (guanine-N(7)-)-methyltransferase